MANRAMAQTSSNQTPVYTGNLGGGFALTGGNTETRNFNLTAAFLRDPKSRNVIKANVAYLRGDQNDVLAVDRTALSLRDEYTVSGRTFVFGQVEYLRDQFKDIIFLWAPTGGIGYKLFSTDSTEFILDGGAGGVIEKNPGINSSTSGSLVTGQRFQQRISSTATLRQSLSTIFKTSDFNDSLTNFAVGIVTTIVGNLELKLEFIDSYKNKPPTLDIKKNDTAFVTAFVLKF
jgi:putative salt-induced outer membrane protein YdiY